MASQPSEQEQSSEASPLINKANSDLSAPLAMDMNTSSADDKPSDVRKRLSVTLTAPSPSAEDATCSKLDPFPSGSASASGRSSPGKSKRTSILTEVFARSSTSASFREQTIRPTVIMSMLYLQDPDPDIDVLREVLGERLLQIPRFSSTFRLHDDKMYCDRIPTSEVDLEHHITRYDGRGTFGPDDVSEMISAASQEWWDATRPLWQLTLVANMTDGRSLMFCKIDHAIGDGVAMLDVLKSLLDDPPEETRSFQHKRPMPPSVRWSTKLVWYLFGVYEGLIGWMVKPIDPENGLKIPKDKAIGDAGSKTFTETKPYALSTIRGVKSKLVGSSVNDVIMAAVTIGIRRYLERTGDPILDDIDNRGASLQAMAMVNLRSSSSSSSSKRQQQKVQNLGNDFATVNFELPLRFDGEADAVFRIKALMDFFKASPALVLMRAFGLRLLAILPESALVQATMETIRKPSCIISNVMGPQFECTLAGNVIEDINFLTSSVIGLYVGIISYNGRVRISFTTDKIAKINCSLLKECFEGAIEDLEQAILKPGKEIEQPDMSPRSAKVVECAVMSVCVAATAVAVSYLVASVRRN